MTEIETLKRLGLTEYESRIVLSLIRLGPTKVSEIYKDCYVPKNKVYESLQTLANKCIIEVIPSLPKRYSINTNALDSLIKNKQDELNKARIELENIKKIKQNQFPGAANEPVLIIYGHQPFVIKLKEATSKIKKDGLILARKIRADPVLIRITTEAIQRGAKIRMLLPPDVEKSKAKPWQKIGVDVRYLKVAPNMTFSTFDNFLCRVNLNVTDNINDPTLWIESPAFIHFLRERFNSLWRSASL